MAMKLGSDLPSLNGATEWMNGQVDAAELAGQPVLVHFWSVSCYLCKKNFPALEKWRAMHAENGLKIISVHMPRQPEDVNPDLVRAALNEFSLTEPCAVDDEHEVKDAFQNDQAWVPAYFLFDAQHKLKSRTAGDAGISMMQNALDRLMSKTGPDPIANAGNS